MSKGRAEMADGIRHCKGEDGCRHSWDFLECMEKCDCPMGDHAASVRMVEQVYLDAAWQARRNAARAEYEEELRICTEAGYPQAAYVVGF